MADIPLSSTELGNLWQAYQEKSMALHVMNRFFTSSDDKEIQDVLQSALDIETKNINTIKHFSE
ncbi:DUF3231 family protein [Lentibacillus sp. CBA3610]|nr:MULTISPECIES: DUF3231 family protein [Lentibacillus]QKY71329.1 DUF3231 family protein [Lentibacillus sp. CBA3610]